MTLKCPTIFMFLLAIVSIKINPRLFRRLQNDDGSSDPEQKSESNFLPPGTEKVNAVEMQVDPITRQMKVVSNDFEEQTPPSVKHVYALDIQDLLRLEDYMNNLKQQFEVKVFGNLDTFQDQNQFDLAYLYYKNLRGIRNNYFSEKQKIEEKIDYLKKISEYGLGFIESATTAQLTQVIHEKTVDLDAYNKFILLQLAEKLDSEMSELYQSITQDLPNLFAEYDRINVDRNLSTYELVNKNIEISFKLTIFRESQLNQRIDLMVSICRSIDDNQDYHHLSDTSNAKIVFSTSIWKSLMLLNLILMWV